MAQPSKTAKMTLLTIIGSSELQDRLIEDLRGAGAKGYTFALAGGGGLHGPRKRGMWDTGNVRIESIVSADVATRMLARIDKDYEGQSLIAFVHDVQAAPHKHFAVKES